VSDRIATLRNYQIGIARSWLKRGQATNDPFAKFMFFFAGFNALYFLVRLEERAQGNEMEDVTRLVRRLGETACDDILRCTEPESGFFRQTIILNMSRRNVSRIEGDETQGRELRATFESATSSVDRLAALSRILYLVRCNLVHGSKRQAGDDERIVSNSVRPLELLLERGIEAVQANRATGGGAP